MASTLASGRDFDARDRAGAAASGDRQSRVRRDGFSKTATRSASSSPTRGLPERETPSRSSAWSKIRSIDRCAPRWNRRCSCRSRQWQNPGANVSLGIRSAGAPPLSLTRSLSDALGKADPQASLTFFTLSSQVDASLIQERLLARLSTFFGGLALLLASLGLYGVTAYSVNRRRGEIGIRMALGADACDVVRMVLGRVAVLVASAWRSEPAPACGLRASWRLFSMASSHPTRPPSSRRMHPELRRRCGRMAAGPPRVANRSGERAPVESLITPRAFAPRPPLPARSPHGRRCALWSDFLPLPSLPISSIGSFKRVRARLDASAPAR